MWKLTQNLDLSVKCRNYLQIAVLRTNPEIVETYTFENSFLCRIHVISFPEEHNPQD